MKWWIKSLEKCPILRFVGEHDTKITNIAVEAEYTELKFILHEKNENEINSTFKKNTIIN